MQTTRDATWAQWLIPLLMGTVAALGIWLMAGQPDAVAFGFVIAAVAHEAGASRGCARRLVRGAR